MGIPLACGTDANRATSYNPWIGVHWLLTGKTLGGGKLQGDQNLLDRTEALRLYTAGGAWISSEEGKKGTLEAGKLADLVILSGDYFSMPVDEVKDLESRADHGRRQGGLRRRPVLRSSTRRRRRRCPTGCRCGTTAATIRSRLRLPHRSRPTAIR